MENKGFTLVELIVSITLILLLFTIIVPAGIKLNNNAKIKECENIKDEILTAVDLYVDSHMVNGKVSFSYVTLKQLYDEDLIEREYKIDINGTKIFEGKWNNEDLKINITRTNSSVDYKDDELKEKMGYYTYSLEKDICYKKNEPLNKTLADTILAKEKPITTSPQFTTDSTDKGLYKLQGDIAAGGKNIYYYRGAVDNNYVQFGTYTKEVKNQVYENSVKQQTVAQKGDPILWRIVRINEDGSVKLIAEHNIGDTYHVWNSNGKSDYEGSTIKKTIDDWYKETFETTEEYPENKELATLIQDTEFCNDRSGDNYNAVYARLKKTPPEPTLKCSQVDIITAKAGLISADEIVYAGALNSKGVTNNTTYLNNNTYFWTISPRSSASLYSSASVFYWSPYPYYLYMDSQSVSSANFVAARPVITLSSEASTTSGSGTSTDPWVIK